MFKKWIFKLGAAMLVLMLTVGCGMTDDENDPRNEPDSEEPGGNNQDDKGDITPENERYDQNRHPDQNENQNQNRNNQKNDYNHDELEGYQ